MTASGHKAFCYHSPCPTSFSLKLLTHSLRYAVSSSVAIVDPIVIIANCFELSGNCVCEAACVANGRLLPYRTRYCDMLSGPLRYHRPPLSPPLSSFYLPTVIVAIICGTVMLIWNDDWIVIRRHLKMESFPLCRSIMTYFSLRFVSDPPHPTFLV